MQNTPSQARRSQAPFDVRRAILASLESAPSASLLRRGACASLCALLAACNADAVSIGADDAAFGSEQKPECRSDVAGRVVTHNQHEVDALAGCEEIYGGLLLSPFEGMDLQPLRWLRVVHGELSIGGGFLSSMRVESLEGLEALERVHSLWLTNVDVSDLSSLGSLTIVASDPINQDPLFADGSIYIEGCNQLRDLSGLAQLTVWSELLIKSSANLESLNGLRIGRQTGRVFLQSLPKLQDLRALAPTKRIDSLSILGTSLEALDGLESVIEMGELSISFNPNLRSLQTLSGLAWLEQMNVTDNAILEQLPQPPWLTGLGMLRIVNNHELRAVPRYHGNLDLIPEGFDGRSDLDLGFQSIEITHNSKLREIALPTNHVTGQNVSVHDNQALTDLDVGGLRSVDALEIRDNASLSQLALRDLERVDDLTVVNNPQLSTGAFDSVQTFTRDMSGNLSGAGAAPAP